MPVDKIVAYKIRYDRSVHRLTQEVQGHINDGWEPHGQLIFGNDQYCQVVVRYEENPDG